MGGRVGIHIRPARPPRDASADYSAIIANQARHAAASTMRRIGSWAGRLTRFDTSSELSRLNADPADDVPVGPTLAAVLGSARILGRATDGIVDAALLAERLAAEGPLTTPPTADPPRDGRRWTVDPRRRGGVVHRTAGVGFDLGGIAKGWIADRAAYLLSSWPAVLVDADGDLALSLAFGQTWDVAVADPRTGRAALATFRISGLDPAGTQRFGLATSGTSVHRWVQDGLVSHHLIDPRTGRPAASDIVQATVLADSATAAEAAAKTIVILGSDRADRVLEHAAIHAFVFLTDDGRSLASPSVLRWLA